MTKKKEWVAHPTKRVRQPACVSLPKTTYVSPPVSLRVFIIFLSTMMHLSLFKLVFNAWDRYIYMEDLS